MSCLRRRQRRLPRRSPERIPARLGTRPALPAHRATPPRYPHGIICFCATVFVVRRRCRIVFCSRSSRSSSFISLASRISSLTRVSVETSVHLLERAARFPLTFKLEHRSHMFVPISIQVFFASIFFDPFLMSL